jgi:putative membrane protein
MKVRSMILAWVCIACASMVSVQGGPGQPQPEPQGKEQAQAPDKTKGDINTDGMFMREAAMSSMAEVAHGQLATKNASAETVKTFAQRMVGDHTKANEELRGLASQTKVNLPTELDQKHQAMQDKLAKMKGDAFDKAYMQHMVTAHEQAVSLFQRESKSGKDAQAKAWATKTLPVLQEHLKMAKEVSSKIGGTQ